MNINDKTPISRKALIVLLIMLISSCSAISASGPYPARYEGSMLPIPLTDLPAPVEVPDSLTPFFVNHVGRHGARFLSSASKTSHPMHTLLKAQSAGNLTPLGEEFLALLEKVDRLTADRWGQLSALGAREQELIAARLDSLYPGLLAEGDIRAIASYVPRCVSSMYAFCHELSLRHPRLAITACSGPQFNPLMRYFTTDSAYAAYLKDGEWQAILDAYESAVIPEAPARRLVGDSRSRRDLQRLTVQIYAVVQGLPAMGLAADPAKWFTPSEYENCWRAADVGHALKRTATPWSDLPVEAARPLLDNIITVADSVMAGQLNVRGYFRFGHAETLMPLLSLMRVEGCTIPADAYVSEIPDVWQDYHVVPLAANLQLIYFRAPSGRVYICAYLNCRPVHLIPSDPRLIIPWPEYKDRLRAIMKFAK